MNSSDIARLAGVSRSTVSRVINNYSNVPDDTRVKVEKIIEEYGYVPNTLARSLVGKHPKILGLFIIDFFHRADELPIHASPVYLEFVGYASDIAYKYAYNVLLTVIRPENTDEVRRLFKSGTISGAIVLGDTLDEGMVYSLAKSGCKFALHNQIAKSPHRNIITVNYDGKKCAELATRRLLEHGHKKIAHITGDFGKLGVRQRFEGFLECLSRHGVAYCPQYLVSESYHRKEGGYRAMQHIFESCPDDLPTAIMVNSVMAMGALRFLNERGVRVPDEISIVAMDGIDESRYINPTMCEIVISKYDIINTCIEKLIDLIEEDSVECNDYNLDSIALVEGASVRNIDG